ncbi:MAG: VIT1/CCC1 transporter family protein [Clostridium sp.]|uniref:VIT1/CCC1 transporter family protein n=1 Tax=Clostridium sp. TaxID=1506 RepID=UPI003D6D7460
MNRDVLLKIVKKLQSEEITEREIYIRIAKDMKNDSNRDTLLKIADEELLHYEIWKKYTGEDVKPSKAKIFYYTMISKVFGYTFTIKQMENRANNIKIDQSIREELSKYVPEIDTIKEQELVHERELIALLDEERLRYVGSMVLGLNDALVEFTGSLAGYTFAMQSNKLILLVGLITGISATLSMSASEFLSARADGNENALKSATYTGFAYLITVVLLISPYLLLPDNMYGQALAIMLVLVVIIIAGFNYYISVAKDLSFKKRFTEMATISLSVAGISFVIGILVKKFLGIDL